MIRGVRSGWLVSLIACTLFLMPKVSISAPNDHFVTTWKTDNPGTSNSTSITIPTTGGGYNYDVDWDNDGTFDQFGITGNITHDFGIAGTYTIRIQGAFPRIYFNSEGDKRKILSVDQWGTGTWTSMRAAFYDCTNLAGNASDVPDLSSVTDMQWIFAYARTFNQDVSSWDTSNVTNMKYFFLAADVFNQDIGSWDTSSVTDLSYMFYSANAFNQDISSWDTGNVTDMSYMFYFANAFNQPIGAWNTSNVLNMSNMFSISTFNQPLGTWDTSNVTNMSYMFYFANAFNQPIGAWNTSNVLNMSNMFSISTFNQPLGTWDTSNVTDMSGMFSNAGTFNQDIGTWNVGNVTDASTMFDNVTLSITNYDALLIGWDTQVLQSGVTFSGGNSQYCAGAAARSNMIVSDSWIITDGGQFCTPTYTATPTLTLIPTITHTPIVTSTHTQTALSTPTATPTARLLEPLLSNLIIYPNPFRAPSQKVTIQYMLSEDADVSITFYTYQGAKIKSIHIWAGEHGGHGETHGYTNQVSWDGRNNRGLLQSTGGYICRIVAKSRKRNMQEKATLKIGLIR